MKHLAPKIYNFDSFKVGYNSLMYGGLSPPAIISNYRDGSVCVTHREYIGDIDAAQIFTTKDLDINPGLQSSFPWLSQIANSFEEYMWKGLIFEFKSMSSDAVLSTANSSALGTVVMATQYNALSSFFSNKREMANYEYANSSKPSVSFIHPVDCRMQTTPHPMLFVRNTDNIKGDKRLYDIGSFQIAVQGCQSNQGVIGELWVSFEICFYKPKFQAGSNSMTDMFLMPFNQSPENIGAPLGTGSRTLGSANPDGKTTFKSPPQINGNLGGVIDVIAETYDFPDEITDGIYEVVYWVNISGSPTAYSAPAFASLVNCRQVPVQGFYDFKTTEDRTLEINFQVSSQIQVTGPGASFQLTGLAWSGGTGAVASFCVTELFGNLYAPQEE